MMQGLLSVLCSLIIPCIMMLNNGKHDDYWYDFYHKYYKYPKEMTDSIDRALMLHPNQSMIGKIKIITPNYFIPDEGNHYLYQIPMNHEPNPNIIQRYFFSYIGLCKKREIVGSMEIFTYTAWVKPTDNKIIHAFNQMIIESDNQTIHVFQIDTSTVEPQSIYVRKIYRLPTSVQKSVIDMIMNHWKKPNSFKNTKIFLHGKSGIGKTFTAYGLKKEIELLYGNDVMLYDDFNPSVIGVSIQKILANARKDMPVIIVMNEIDIAYKKVFASIQSYDPRGSYTTDKTSFNNMLDYISTIRYIIVIFTSEKSPQQLLDESLNYTSFLRQGRIDMFIEMKHDSINTTHLIKTNESCFV